MGIDLVDEMLTGSDEEGDEEEVEEEVEATALEAERECWGRRNRGGCDNEDVDAEDVLLCERGRKALEKGLFADDMAWKRMMVVVV